MVHSVLSINNWSLKMLPSISPIQLNLDGFYFYLMLEISTSKNLQLLPYEHPWVMLHYVLDEIVLPISWFWFPGAYVVPALFWCLEFILCQALLRCDLPFYMVPFTTGDIAFEKPKVCTNHSRDVSYLVTVWHVY